MCVISMRTCTHRRLETLQHSYRLVYVVAVIKRRPLSAQQKYVLNCNCVCGRVLSATPHSPLFSQLLHVVNVVCFSLAHLQFLHFMTVSVCLAASGQQRCLFVSWRFNFNDFRFYFYYSTTLFTTMSSSPLVHYIFFLPPIRYVTIVIAVVCGNFRALLQVRTINVYSYRHNKHFRVVCQSRIYYPLTHTHTHSISYKAYVYLYALRYIYVCKYPQVHIKSQHRQLHKKLTLLSNNHKL